MRPRRAYTSARSRPSASPRSSNAARAVRGQRFPYRRGGAEPRDPAQQGVHRAAGDQLGTVVVDAHDRSVTGRGVAQGSGPVAGDQGVGGYQDGCPLLVRAREHQTGVEGRSQAFGQLVTAEQTPFVGVHDERQLVLVVGELGGQLHGQFGAPPQQGFRSPRRGEDEQRARPGAQRRAVAVAEGQRGEDAFEGGIADDLGARGGVRAGGGEPGDPGAVGQRVQCGLRVAVGRQQVLGVQSGGGVGRTLARNRLVESRSVRQQHVCAAEQAQFALRARHENEIVVAWSGHRRHRSRTTRRRGSRTRAPR
ncbi:hypothetical protein [Streptomyces sp. NPDC014734]|uniref:hypothetical protein n=1 Tax=Streptomyces sp. NPDC014734 TaxID=3364886 RepID=UPI0036FC7DC2